MNRSYPLSVTVQWDGYGQTGVYIGHSLVGYRPYDGSSAMEIIEQVEMTLADLLNEKFEWSREDPDGDD